MRRRSGGISALYRDYNEFRATVIGSLADLIRRTKGNMLTFTAKKVAVNAGLPPQPILLTLVKDVLEALTREGLISRFSRSSHGTKYVVTRDSPLWKLAKGEGLISEVDRALLEAAQEAAY